MFATSEGVAWGTLVLLLPIYYFLHIYLESVLPDAYGINETCCFCLRGKKKPVEEENDEEGLAITKTDPSIQQDDLEASMRDKLIGNGNDVDDKLVKRRNTLDRRQSMARKAFDSRDPVQMKKLTMMFGEFRAVDELTLSVKQDEIIALLGHNGAGKTTAIYMLTGMLMPASGDATINGLSIKRQTD